MSFAKQSVSKQDVAQSASNYITSSGVYPVNILAAFVSTNEKDSSVVDFFLDHNSQNQVLYGNVRVTNNGGEDNKIGKKLLNQLMIVADVEEIDDAVEMELPIGKAGADKTVAVLESLGDKEVQVHIQLEYSRWNNKIQERKNIRGFFRVGDNASAEEIVNKSNHGAAYSKSTKYFTDVTYKDVTEEEITAWIASNRTNSGVSSAAAVKTPSFGAPKAFGVKK